MLQTRPMTASTLPLKHSLRIVTDPQEVKFSPRGIRGATPSALVRSELLMTAASSSGSKGLVRVQSAQRLQSASSYQKVTNTASLANLFQLQRLQSAASLAPAALRPQYASAQQGRPMTASAQEYPLKQPPKTTKGHIFSNAQIQTQIKGIPPRYQLIKK